MKKILIILSILVLSLNFNHSSLATDGNTSVKNEVVNQSAVKNENNKVNQKSASSNDIQSLVMQDDYDWGKIISKVLRALFLGIAAFLGLIAFLVIKNRNKFNKNINEINEESHVVPSSENTTESHLSQQNDDSNSKTNSNSDELVSAVYNFFNINK